MLSRLAFRQVRTFGVLSFRSSFINDLPKVKLNRFAERFEKSEQRSKPKNNSKNDSKHNPRHRNNDIKQNGNKQNLKANVESNGPKDSFDKMAEYKRLREKLKQKEKKSSPQQHKKQPTNNSPKPKQNIKISVPTFVTVSNLSSILGIPLNSLLKNLENMGFENMRHNYILDKENVALIAEEFGFEINMNDDTGLDLFPAPVPENSDKLKPRAPVVTIMGHVDHGKTTILDFFRKSSIVDKEFGGITQHIGAFSVTTPVSKKKITFLDTPGHAAFLKMRQRGAIVTDIVILVVAADDSVMPQTIEAIKHAKEAGVPIIVAINKCDKPGVKVDKVLGDLARYEVDIEDYGGDTQTVQVSGKTGLNMDKLEESIITLSEMNDFRAEPNGIPSEGWIIESEIVKGMGPIATALITRSSVKVGDFLVAGKTYCKVRGMKDENGKPIKIAGPSTPVQIWGWKDLPDCGDRVLQATNEKIAKKVCDNRASREKELAAIRDIETINTKRQQEVEELAKQERINELKLQGFTDKDLEEEFKTQSQAKVVNYIIRADVFGSAQAVKESIEGLGNEEVKAKVVQHEAGPPSDSDVDLAAALGAKIYCFNTKATKSTQSKANRDQVEIKEHNIIYRLIEDVTEELSDNLVPIIETKVLSEVEIQGVFLITGKQKKKTKVAGCKVTNGILKRSAKVKVLRKGQVVYTGTLSSLKQAKDDVSETKKGHECGVSFDNWDKFEAGDQVQAYEEVSHKRYL